MKTRETVRVCSMAWQARVCCPMRSLSLHRARGCHRGTASLVIVRRLGPPCVPCGPALVVQLPVRRSGGGLRVLVVSGDGLRVLVVSSHCCPAHAPAYTNLHDM